MKAFLSMMIAWKSSIIKQNRDTNNRYVSVSYLYLYSVFTPVGEMTQYDP